MKRLGIVGPSSEPLLSSIARSIKGRSVSVSFLPEGALPEDISSFDLMVLRSKDMASLDWAGRQAYAGARFTPSPGSILNVKDRRACRQLLIRGGVIVPDAVTVGPETPPYEEMIGLLPLVIKLRRTHGRAVQLVETVRQLREQLKARDSCDEVIAERYISGRHFTAYFIGERIFVFAKQEWVGDEYEDPCPIDQQSPEISGVVKKYRDATGLGFGKIDLVESNAGLFCVDGGVFPKFRHVPSAGVLLADHIMGLI